MIGSVDPPELGITINTAHVEYEAPEPPLVRRSRLPALAFIAGAMAMAGTFGLPGGGPSAASIRHDPRRPKTPKDLERMAAAQRKRDRKAARKGPPNESSPSVGAKGKANE